jgi:hypothetical protein
MKTLPPEAASGRLPLEGAPPTARQSRFRGGPGIGSMLACALCLAEEI